MMIKGIPINLNTMSQMRQVARNMKEFLLSAHVKFLNFRENMGNGATIKKANNPEKSSTNQGLLIH